MVSRVHAWLVSLCVHLRARRRGEEARRICGTDDESVLSGAQTAYSSDFPRAKMSFQALTMQDSRPSWMQKTLGSAPRATLLMQLCAGSKRPLASLGLWVVSEV